MVLNRPWLDEAILKHNLIPRMGAGEAPEPSSSSFLGAVSCSVNLHFASLLDSKKQHAAGSLEQSQFYQGLGLLADLWNSWIIFLPTLQTVG